MADEKRKRYSPTKADLWDELCATREELLKAMKESNQVIASNTVAQDKTIELLSRMQTSIERLNNRLEREIGIPPKIFIMVVGVLLLILLSVAGLKVSEVLPFIE